MITRDKSATIGLYELAAALKTTTAHVRELFHAGKLPWPLRDRAGKTIRPYRWLVLELMTCANWHTGRRNRGFPQGIDTLCGTPRAPDAKSAALLNPKKKEC
jgi:hypothetical protein